MIKAFVRAAMAALAAVGLIALLEPWLPEPMGQRTLLAVLVSATAGHFLYDAWFLLRARRTRRAGPSADG